MAQTSFSEIKLVIAQLLQQKMQQLTLIEASDFYVFEYIDPPAAMENKSEPSRAAICIIGAILIKFGLAPRTNSKSFFILRFIV